MINKRQIGNQYENIAEEYLIEQGYRIHARNYRNAQGEIDIIAYDVDGTICYMEIKYRSSKKYGDPLEAVNLKKQKKISKVARYHYARYGADGRIPCRFDVIGIHADGSVQHIKNAFEYQE